jgi:pentose-5-phosphate-3-epimerase
VAEAGADSIVSGSAIFGTDDYTETISKMRAEIDSE